jgi:3-oxoacyl-[acyl-carrier protein] reductase
LTGFVAGVARTKTAAQGVTINNILPGKFDTDRIRSNVEVNAQKMGKTVAEIRALQQSQVPAGRYGTPQEFGSLCAYICSQQASYITGQNFLTDGGAYPGTY